MPQNPNQLLELKIAGRYRMIPVWASKLSFEVRPGLKFDSRAWKLWKPVLTLLNEIAKKKKSSRSTGLESTLTLASREKSLMPWVGGTMSKMPCSYVILIKRPC
jgi:hypothetical protein